MCIISEKAVLVSQKITHWSGRKLDKSATAKFNSDNHADDDAGRYNKLLIAKDAIKQITKASGAARTAHYRLTLPWADNGQRVLPTKLFWEYTEELQGFKDQFYVAVEKFCDAYPDLVADAKARLGDLYDPDDYPPTDEVRRKFSFNYDITPVPDTGDFRVDIEKAALDDLSEQLKGRLLETQKEAMREVWGRLREAVKAVSDRFSGKTDEKVIFRDSLIGNIRDICELVPKMNLEDDPELDRLAEEVKLELASIDPQALRDFPIDRVKAKAKADDIVKKMAAFM